MKKIIWLLPLAVVLASCEFASDINMIEGEGEVITEDRYVGEFTKVESQIAADVEIIESDEPGIVISAQKNLLPYLDTDVRRGTLEISFGDYSVETDSTIAITIFTPSLEEFSLTGVGNIDSQLPLNSIILTGVGNIVAHGATENVNVRITGSGNVDLYDMPVEIAEISITGVGNVKVFVSNLLDVSISGMGNVYYKGTPTIYSSITGIGQVVDSN